MVRWEVVVGTPRPITPQAFEQFVKNKMQRLRVVIDSSGAMKTQTLDGLWILEPRELKWNLNPVPSLFPVTFPAPYPNRESPGRSISILPHRAWTISFLLFVVAPILRHWRSAYAGHDVLLLSSLQYSSSLSVYSKSGQLGAASNQRTTRAGFSIALDATTPPSSGYMVAPEKDTEIVVPRDEVYLHHMAQLVENIEALERKYRRKAYAGQWIHNGLAYFDASLHFEDKDEAEEVAERAGQKAIYDLQAQKVTAIIPGSHPYYHLLAAADRSNEAFNAQ